MAEYVIKNVVRREEWDSRYGSKMVTYALGLEGVEGWVKLNQKVESEPPHQGATITGTISDDRGAKKFTKEFNQGGGTSIDNSKLDKILEIVEQIWMEVKPAEDLSEPDPKPTDDDDDIDLSNIPF